MVEKSAMTTTPEPPIKTTNGAPAGTPSASPGGRRATLGACGGGHLVHDGFHDGLLVLLPIWQAAFGLSLTQVGALMTCFSGGLACFQIPAALLAERLGERLVLVVGTAVMALGFAALGAAGGFAALAAILLVAGLASGVQHPLSSSLVARAYRDGGRRMALGTFNFAGDLGKIAFPALGALLIAGAGWPAATAGFGVLGLLAALILYVVLKRCRAGGAEGAESPRADGAQGGDWGITERRGFAVLSAIGAIDLAVRIGFLTFLPFLLLAKGLAVEEVGLVLAMTFAGGAAGKFLCGAVAERIGIVATVIATEVVTGGGLLALPFLPLGAVLVFLPFLGAALNGTSSVLYGTVAEFVTPRRQARAFGLFYTIGVGSGAIAPSLFGLLSDRLGVAATISVIGACALVTIPLALALRAALGGPAR